MVRLFFILALLTPSFAGAALFSGLPSEMKDALKDAYGTKNSYVIEAVTKYTKDKYPNFEDKIAIYANSIQDEQKKAESKVVKKYGVKVSKLSGNFDTSLNVANGNTKRQDLSASSKLNYEDGDWSNTLKLTARGSEESRTRTNEEYIVNNQTRYKLNDDAYSFLELEYVNDRFSGYKYRNAELLGLGYKLFENDDLKISGEASAGARQSQLTDNTKENSLLGKLGAKAEWKISDKVTLNQDINSSFGSESVITTWDTDIKTKLIDSVYLKFNYNLQHIDDAPAGKQHVDSFTSLGVGYEF